MDRALSWRFPVVFAILVLVVRNVVVLSGSSHQSVLLRELVILESSWNHTDTTDNTPAVSAAAAAYLDKKDILVENTTNSNSLSACLLIKDDNEILNEWIAYHFHLWNLRQLVVAVDPTSKTSPQPILKQWAHTFPDSHSSFQYTVWQDQDYMPERFLNGDYSQVKMRLGKLPLKYPNRTFSQEELQQISNHRFRQREFYRKCLAYFDTTTNSSSSSVSVDPSWIAHIDTDEYLSLNPWLFKDERTSTTSITTSTTTTNVSSLTTMVEERRAKVRAIKPTAGALLNVLLENYHSSELCVGLPRLLFGGVERRQRDLSSSFSWNATKLESVRWKYHAPMVTAGPLNGQPKVLLNWNIFQKNKSANNDYYNNRRQKQRNQILDNIHSIHQPHKDACPKSVSFDGSLSKESSSSTAAGPPWLAIHHYLGSVERYMSREDPRRTRETYIDKANQTEGPIGNQMDGWLDEFVLQHGVDKVSQVLADNLIG